ncbi:hypothetical protein E2C01_024859 [Portunus trituberculatus]|uniref:Uncharacterized protein n=1 Tax=Portunus trituberculatus TaxID=210409 RepID=A0A5B7EDX8_PORTR|nr:hypothetical protein [Portunus trituberculatus]
MSGQPVIFSHFEATSGNPHDPEGGNGTPNDVMSVLHGNDIEDSDENEDSDFFIETEESEEFSSDSDSDLGERPTLTATFINLLTYSPRAMRWAISEDDKQEKTSVFKNSGIFYEL